MCQAEQHWEERLAKLSHAANGVATSSAASSATAQECPKNPGKCEVDRLAGYKPSMYYVMRSCA